jgi:uncharacterized damage-inducible protein DinB
MRDAITNDCGCSVGPVTRFTAPLAELLGQLARVIEGLTAAEYVQNPVGVVHSSVGGHVRHCLDHVRALLESVETGRLDYDHRARGTAIETNRAAAVAEIDRLTAALRDLRPDAPSRLVRMSVLLATDEPPVSVYSTVGREIAYTLSHTIHHNALIAAMVRTLGGTLPDRFGYAPATVRAMSNG